MFDAIVSTPLGPLGVECTPTALFSLDWLHQDHPIQSPSSSISAQVSHWVQSYFNDPNTPVPFEIDASLTPHQQKVFDVLMATKPGQVLTYGQIAKLCQSSPRAVGGALRANPVPLVIPCHRVIAAAGLGGFMGAKVGRPMEIKRTLLTHEGYGC